MTLYLIGLGLADKKDITVNGFEIINSCDLIYLENYTSLLQCTKEDLEQYYHKKIILADRELTEQNSDQLINKAKHKNIALLVIGDPFSATTHIELFKQAHRFGVEVKVINNASILTAIGITGLQLYQFGKTTSIPFHQENLETPYCVLKDNQSLGLHTLFLLDLQPEENKFMTINQALESLGNIETKKQSGLINDETLIVGCARLGSDTVMIKAGKFKDIKLIDFGKPPHCLIIPGRLHFIEKEMLELYL